MAAIGVQYGQRVFGQMLGLLMVYIFLGDEIVLLVRVERSLEKMRRMQDCAVVVKPQTRQKDKLSLEVSPPLLDVISILGFVI